MRCIFAAGEVESPGFGPEDRHAAAVLSTGPVTFRPLDKRLRGRFRGAGNAISSGWVLGEKP